MYYQYFSNMSQMRRDKKTKQNKYLEEFFYVALHIFKNTFNPFDRKKNTSVACISQIMIKFKSSVIIVSTVD